jgi:Glycosyltransferase family 87
VTPRATRRSLRPSREAIVACAVFVVAAAAVTVAWERLGHAVTDIPLYRTYGERVASGLVPYRDFGFEYPPGALPAIVLPALVTSSLRAYRIVFAAEMAVVGAVGVLALDAALRRLGTVRRERTIVLSVVALLPLLLGGVILTRFDLVPAALVTAGVALVVAGRLRAAAVMIGVGVAVKLYPVVLVPLLGVQAWRSGGRRELATVLALAAAPVALAYLPFLLFAPDGVLDSIGRQLGRPLQIESLGAGVLLALHHAFGLSLDWASGSGSQNLTGTGADAVAVLQGIAQAVAVALVWLSFARGPATTERLVRHAAAAVVAFVALSKVLSPQFLVWLVLLVPLVGGPRRRAALLLTVVACVLTAVWFPARYWDLVFTFDPLASWLVLLRGVTLLALLAALTWPATGRAPARSRSPVPSPGRT